MSEAHIITDPQTMEMQLAEVGVTAIVAAKKTTIRTNEEYEGAAAFLREIKSRAKRIKDYWAPAKEKAKAAHQDIVNREKAMLVPLSDAEKIIKDEMTRYQIAAEKARREAEALARKRQQEEAERLLEQAAAAEQSGDEIEAATSMAMAEMVEDMRPIATVATSAPSATGTSVRKTWKARIIDATAVPVEANGMVIRPINESAINSIARLTKGTASIPGVEFYEDVSLAVRA